MMIIISGSEVCGKDVDANHVLAQGEEMVQVSSWPGDARKGECYYDKGEVKLKTQTMLDAERKAREDQAALAATRENLLDIIATSTTLAEIKTKIAAATPITRRM